MLKCEVFLLLDKQVGETMRWLTGTFARICGHFTSFFLYHLIDDA